MDKRFEKLKTFNKIIEDIRQVQEMERNKKDVEKPKQVKTICNPIKNSFSTYIKQEARVPPCPFDPSYSP